MTRGQLPKAYLRIDPDIDYKHRDNLDGFIRLLCAANRQMPRGTFHDRQALDGVFGKSMVDRFYRRGDVAENPDGTVSVVGWDHWQEGNIAVAERMRAYRERKSVTKDVTVDVTQGVTERAHEGNGASEASRRLGVKASRRPSDERGARDPLDTAHVWLAEHRADVPYESKAGLELADLVDKKGLQAVVAAMESLGDQDDGRQYVFGAMKILKPLPNPPRPDPAAEREEEARRAFDRGVERTRREMARIRGEASA